MFISADDISLPMFDFNCITIGDDVNYENTMYIFSDLVEKIILKFIAWKGLLHSLLLKNT